MPKRCSTIGGSEHNGLWSCAGVSQMTTVFVLVGMVGVSLFLAFPGWRR